MKTVILAGGFGTRLSEETATRPKPMVEVGGRPLLWHIMKLFSHYGHKEFIICLGYKGNVIKEFFANYFLYSSDVTLHLADGKMDVHNSVSEDWSVTLVDTGPETLTGGRLKRIRNFLNEGEPFFMTYGDGLANVDIAKLATFAQEQQRLAVVTAVNPPGRFGALKIEDNSVKSFHEKPSGGWVNGGYFVLRPAALDQVEGDHVSWEREPLEALAKMGQLAAFHHDDFWLPVDTLRDKRRAEELWQSGDAPWRIW